MLVAALTRSPPLPPSPLSVFFFFLFAPRECFILEFYRHAHEYVHEYARTCNVRFLAGNSQSWNFFLIVGARHPVRFAETPVRPGEGGISKFQMNPLSRRGGGNTSSWALAPASPPPPLLAKDDFPREHVSPRYSSSK